MTYVKEYTNAAFLIDPAFKTSAEADGKFSGFVPGDADPNFGKYDKATWKWQKGADGIPLKDKTLQDPHCVFQLLKKQFERYDPETVCGVTGTDLDTYLKVCETYAHRSGPRGRSGTIMYAMGTTQHTHGTQNIRSYAILQLLLGNVGVAGGGINALRGESNVQGSTDHCLLFHILPGYLTPPRADQPTLQAHLDAKLAGLQTSDPKSASWWLNYPKYYVSLLKSWYGDSATEANDFGYEWLPKLNPGTNYSHIAVFEAMAKGDVKGLFCWGQNPAVGGPNSFAERGALQKLDWLVSVDLWETETCAFWQDPLVNSASINTEVFALPAACSYEKEGSISNSGRWSQWRYKAVEPLGDATPDLEILNELMVELISLYEGSDDPITKLRWKGWYDANPLPRGADSLVDLVSREINGWAETTIKNDDGSVKYEEGKLMASFGHLLADGSTSSSNWLYTQSYTEMEGEGVNAGEKNRQKWRDNTDYHPAGIGLYSKWSWCWPINRRIIYNRASVDLDGKPWDPDDFVIRWTGPETKWEGDVPDGGWAPMNMEGTRYPFIMKPEGFARIFGPGRTDGPFPEHYEPMESPLNPHPLSNTQNNPAITIWRPEEFGTPDEYPIVATTYRVTEHWQAGQMTRNLPWLVELMPQMFIELSEELADELNINNAELVTVESKRGSLQANAIITKRFRPFMVDGKQVHQIGLPWHWGFLGLCVGDSANKLTPHVGDANTMIPEYKAFLVRVTKGGV
jgi:formate dehydrogenase major subunit